jgi:hypothetical protein
MIEISTLLLVSLWCFGVHAAFQNDMLLGRLGAWVEQGIGYKWCRPLFGCPPCMASVHGGVFAIVAYDFTYTAVIFVICLCGLNYVINQLLPE